jgi:hypothetical protein
VEKLFFSIARWLMLVGAAIAFVFLIGGGIYAFNLYNISKDTHIKKSVYTKKTPSVTFDEFNKLHQQKLEQATQSRLKIEKYVLKVIKNGSSGHGFSMNSMPKNIVDSKEAKIVARYISNGLVGKQPNSYSTVCASCHGIDGKGEGVSPSLLKLPIYNGLVSSKADTPKYAPGTTQSSKEKNKNPLKQYSAKMTEIINKYALLVEQKGVTNNQIFSYLQDLKKDYNKDSFEGLKVQLLEAMKSLLKYAKRLDGDKHDAIKYEEFILWFVDNYKQQIKNENQKYQYSINKLEQEKNQKLLKASDAKAKLYQLATLLGVALIAFILLTMILVLFKIELNTRNHKTMQES